ncbi:unnamed protein product [Linum trigynum]|uniref:Uncharacterized protein n=1 Tax=Linum trigynum TaxID=586398 RepID=A0AAV2FSE8_9ROSI
MVHGCKPLSISRNENSEGKFKENDRTPSDKRRAVIIEIAQRCRNPLVMGELLLRRKPPLCWRLQQWRGSAPRKLADRSDVGSSEEAEMMSTDIRAFPKKINSDTGNNSVHQKDKQNRLQTPWEESFERIVPSSSGCNLQGIVNPSPGRIYVVSEYVVDLGLAREIREGKERGSGGGRDQSF